MSRGPATFRKSDAKRLIEAAESAGMKIGRVEYSKEGKIILFPQDNSNARADAADSGVELDSWLAKKDK
jgi:hypothetical protein